jgi:threonine dehydratase
MSSGYQRSLQASIRLANEVVLTPLLTSPALDKLLGCNLFVKAENLQRTGSFKFRGAYNKLSSLNEDERECGVVTFSSGNHAQAVAFAAQLFKCDAKILMPSDSPRIKVENTKLYGGEVIFYDRDKDDRIALARETAEKFGATLIPPFDDTEIMAGQGMLHTGCCDLSSFFILFYMFIKRLRAIPLRGYSHIDYWSP